MNTEIAGITVTFLLTVLLALPLGKYIAKVFMVEKTILDFLNPCERFIYRVCGIDPTKSMNWKEFLKAMLTINCLWFVYGFFLLMFQGQLPFNPDHNPNQTPDLAYNSIISFVTNTNLQHYSGEGGATYLIQLFVFNFLQFVSAATGIACLIALFNAFKERTTNHLGNFWSIFIKSITRLLLPLSIIVATILAFNGTPTSFKGKDTITTLQGDAQQISRGPAAAMIAIKQLGTNGAGYFGANSSVPFENPNYVTNMVEEISIMLIPIALIFSLGLYLKRKKLAYVIFGVMTFFFLLFCITNIYFETKGNPEINKLGITQNIGAMEGKEIRFGSASTAYWSVATTSTSNGSVNGMHPQLRRRQPRPGPLVAGQPRAATCAHDRDPQPRPRRGGQRPAASWRGSPSWKSTSGRWPAAPRPSRKTSSGRATAKACPSRCSTACGCWAAAPTLISIRSSTTTAHQFEMYVALGQPPAGFLARPVPPGMASPVEPAADCPAAPPVRT